MWRQSDHGWREAKAALAGRGERSQAEASHPSGRRAIPDVSREAMAVGFEQWQMKPHEGDSGARFDSMQPRHGRIRESAARSESAGSTPIPVAIPDSESARLCRVDPSQPA
jgi:hypothetical protein